MRHLLIVLGLLLVAGMAGCQAVSQGQRVNTNNTSTMQADLGQRHIFRAVVTASTQPVDRNRGN